MKKDLLWIFSSMKKDLSGSSSSCYVHGTAKGINMFDNTLVIIFLRMYLFNYFYLYFVTSYLRRWSSQAIYLAIY